MSTLSEIEALLPALSVTELLRLERLVRSARREKLPRDEKSIFDLPPLDLGQTKEPLGTRAEWFEEMAEHRV